MLVYFFLTGIPAARVFKHRPAPPDSTPGERKRRAEKQFSRAPGKL